MRWRSRALPSGHWLIAAAQVLHGRCLIRMNRFAEAETELLAAHQVLAADRGQEHDRTVAAIAALVELYRRWERPEEMLRWTRHLQ